MITTGHQEHLAAGVCQQATDRAADGAGTDNHISRHEPNTILCARASFRRGSQDDRMIKEMIA
jgi:hypothetical protein